MNKYLSDHEDSLNYVGNKYLSDHEDSLNYVGNKCLHLILTFVEFKKKNGYTFQIIKGNVAKWISVCGDG